MEDELDEIAMGNKDRLAMLRQFYETGLIPTLKEAGEKVDPRQVCTIPIGEKDGVEVAVRVGRYGPFLSAGDKTAPITDETAPDEVSLEWALEQLAKKAEGPRSLGNDAGGLPIFVMNGRFGPYVQRGEAKDKADKPPRASLMPGMDPSEVTLDTAIKLLSFPKVLGADAEGKEVVASNGKFGPYVKKGTESRSIPAHISLMDVTLEQALALFLEPARRGARTVAPLKELGPSPSGAPIKLLSGRFGPYVTDGTTNANLPKGIAPENLTLEEAVELLSKRAAAGPPVKKGKRKAPDPMTAKVVGEKKPRAKKAAEGEAPAPRARKAKEAAPLFEGALNREPAPKASRTKTSSEPLSALPPSKSSKTSGETSKTAAPKTAKTSKKKAAPPPPPKPVMNNIRTIKASQVGKEAAPPPASAPLSALPPGFIRRK
jgi:DNA topoisomerase-1